MLRNVLDFGRQLKGFKEEKLCNQIYVLRSLKQQHVEEIEKNKWCQGGQLGD